MQGNLIKELQAQLSFLSMVEKKIAMEIIENPKEFAQGTLIGIADKIGVSQGSIVNFAKKFTTGGFPRLKVEVAASISGEHGIPYSKVNANDSGVETYKKVIGGLQNALYNAEKLNADGVIERVAWLIRHAKKVELCGVYRSGLVANDFYYQLLDIGIPAMFNADFYSFTVSASMMESDGLMIAISHTGQTKEVLDAVTLAKENGAKVVAITKNRFSPIAKLADEVLLAPDSGDSLTGLGSEVRIAQLSVTDAICEYLRMHTDVESEERFYRNRKILNMHNVED